MKECSMATKKIKDIAPRKGGAVTGGKTAFK